MHILPHEEGEIVVWTAFLLLSIECQVTLTLPSTYVNSYPPYGLIAWQFINRSITCTVNLDMYQYFDRIFCPRLYVPHRGNLKSRISFRI
jgi:hypothetical protein